MKKIISLIRACMTQNMNLFRFNKKRKSGTTKAIVPILIALLVLFYNWSLASAIMEEFAKTNSEFMLLTLYVVLTFILTLIEGVYKSSGLLFNCKDDNLLFSLPIKKSTVLFVRIFKFYVFELLYNSLFLLPAMAVYAGNVKVDATYYLASFVALLLLPIVPIVLSCIIGGIISASSSKFKSNSIAQIIITTIMLVGVFLLSFNLENVMMNVAQNAENINDAITRIYYPAGAYVKLATNFNVVDLLIFIFIHTALLAVMIIALGKAYFKINSRVKVIKTNTKNCNYKIKVNKRMQALIKKELKKFISIPVFVINSCFGLVLFVIGCIAVTVKFDSLAVALATEGVTMTIEEIKMYLPVLLFGLVCFASFMSSITCSMISIEGKSINIVKSLPVSPFKVILSKIYTAVIIMVPAILIGDLIIFIKFRFSVFETLMLLIASVVLPFLAETIGIIVNLKHPKMDAENDAQVVKQSVSSMVAVFLGMFLVILTFSILFMCINFKINTNLTLFMAICIFTIIEILLLMHLNRKGVKRFNKIQA